MEDRTIVFEGINNCRDLGGLKNSEGKTIRKGCLIRSAHLGEASDNDIKKLQEMHLQTVVDLRTIVETREKPDRYPEETVYHNNYIFPEHKDGISHEEDNRPMDISKINLGETYAYMMKDEHCSRHFGNALKIIMNTDFDNGCVLWHCTEGKDRCGLVSAFLLTVLGVDEDVIREDYLLTNVVNGPKAEHLYSIFKEMGRSEADCEGIRNVILAKEEYLDAALTRIREKYGTMENFLTAGLHLEPEQMKRFREKMLVD